MANCGDQSAAAVVVDENTAPSQRDQKLESGVPEGLEYVGGFAGGIIREYRARMPWCKADWTTDACNAKTLSAGLFMFFATFTSTIALAEHVNAATGGIIGLNEYLLMNSIAGMTHAVFGCQPLLVLRPTGPITLLIEKLLEVSTALELPFWPFFAWTGIFVGVFMFVIAVFELSRFIKYLTPFTENIFATFIGTVYMKDGIDGMLRLMSSANHAAEQLLALNLTLGVAVLALALGFVKDSRLLNYQLRVLISDYALTISVLLSVPVSVYLNDGIFSIAFLDSSSIGFEATDQRPWQTDLTAISALGVLCAALAAVPVVIFFYLDQNISSLACQKPELKLEKGSYYHSSFACMAVFNFFGPLVGLPFVTGSLPHAPQFVHALSLTDSKHRVTGICENRVAPFLGYLLIGVSLAVPSILSYVPKAAISGTLIFVGLSGVQSTQLFERVLLLATDPTQYPAERSYSGMPARTIHFFTLIQIVGVVGCWVCNVLIGLAFPLFVMSLVPFRWKVLPCLFWESDLDRLLAESHPEGEEGAPHQAPSDTVRV